MDHRACNGEAAEPPTLAALKDEVARRWGTIDLLDVLKEADYLTGFTEEFTSVASREIVSPACFAGTPTTAKLRPGDEYGDQAGRRRCQCRQHRAPRE